MKAEDLVRDAAEELGGMLERRTKEVVQVIDQVNDELDFVNAAVDPGFLEDPHGYMQEEVGVDTDKPVVAAEYLAKHAIEERGLDDLTKSSNEKLDEVKSNIDDMSPFAEQTVLALTEMNIKYDVMEFLKRRKRDFDILVGMGDDEVKRLIKKTVEETTNQMEQFSIREQDTISKPAV
ncbi:MAG: hypothetical protein ABEK59_04015 [Halobacteria archaeon]